VKPKVYLVAFPRVDSDALGEYLDTIGAGDWVDNHWQNPDGETLTEVGGRLCYRSWEPGLNPNVTKIREASNEYLLNILRSGHGSVLEHANYSFILQDVSRVLTHEMVRHRAGVAVSQESMRFVRLTDIPFWFPDWVQDDEELWTKCVSLLEYLEAHQQWMAAHLDLDSRPFHEKKFYTSFMRRFAPEGVATSMLLTINIRALRHIVYMRTSLGAEEEIRIVCDMIAEKALEAVPNLMQDYDVTENREWIPEFLKV
jgi:thymidylate synthase (FAD)